MMVAAVVAHNPDRQACSMEAAAEMVHEVAAHRLN
jgi:hypothetical protein